MTIIVFRSSGWMLEGRSDCLLDSAAVPVNKVPSWLVNDAYQQAHTEVAAGRSMLCKSKQSCVGIISMKYDFFVVVVVFTHHDGCFFPIVPSCLSCGHSPPLLVIFVPTSPTGRKMLIMTKKIVVLFISLLFLRSTALRQRGYFGIESRWQRHDSCYAKKKAVVEDATIISQQDEEVFFAQLQELMSKTNIDGQRPNNFKRHERMSENLQNLKEIAVNMTINTTMTTLEATTKQRTRKQVELQDEQRMEESRIDLDRFLQRPKGENNGDLIYIETNEEIVDKGIVEKNDDVVDNDVMDESASSLMNQQDMREMSKMYANDVNGKTNAAASIRSIEELVRQQQLPQLQPREEVLTSMVNEVTVTTTSTTKAKNMAPNSKPKETKVEVSSVPKVLDTEQIVDTVESTRELREIKEMMQQQAQQELEPIGDVSLKASSVSGAGKGKRNEMKSESPAGSKGLTEEQNVGRDSNIDTNRYYYTIPDPMNVASTKARDSNIDIDTILQATVPDPINVASTKARLSLKRAIDEVELLDGFRELMEAEAEQALYVNGSMMTGINGSTIGINGISSGINGTTVSNMKLKRLLCPVCTRPCEQKEMDDFGKCSICRADDLEDRTVLGESSVRDKEAVTESMYLKRRKERQEKFAAEGALQDARLNELKQQQQQQQQQQSPVMELMTTGSIPSATQVSTVTASTNGIKCSDHNSYNLITTLLVFTLSLTHYPVTPFSSTR